MKNIKIDDETMWPNDQKVNLDTPHADARGSIQSLVNFPTKNISIFILKGQLGQIITILQIGTICMF